MKADQEIVAMDGTRAILKQKRRHVYILRITSYPSRHTRWGNWTQIQEDVEYFKIMGHLPPDSGKGWQ